MSISAIIKTLNFFVAQLNKEIDKLYRKADKLNEEADALRATAGNLEHEAKAVRADAIKASRIADKISNIIKE